MSMSFLSNLFGNKSAVVAAQAELDAAKAENAELKAALESKPTEVVEYVEVPVMIETLTGVRVQFGSAKNELDAQTYADQYAGVKTYADLVSYMFVDLNTENINSALVTNVDGTTESVKLNAVLPKVMPRHVVVNTALGKGA